MSAVAGDALSAVVLHDVGDAAGGAPWATALESAGWSGQVVAPDLPGHGRTPAPVGGAYEFIDAAHFVLPLLEELPDRARPIVIGVGAHGWAAELLALGGRARALVLVDGLGGPWRGPVETISAMRDLLRAIAADPEAIAPAPDNGLDPRLRHGMVSHNSQRLARRAAVAVAVPVLLIETPQSPIDRSDVDDLVGLFPAGATVVTAETVDAPSIASVIVTWAASLP